MIRPVRLKRETVRRVYDHILAHGLTSPLRLERELGIDIKIIRAALNRLEAQGKITQRYLTIPQPARVVPKRTAEQPASIPPPKHHTIQPPASIGTGIHVQMPPPPPRTMRIRVPEEVSTIAVEQTRKARTRQLNAKRRHQEIKMQSTRA